MKPYLRFIFACTVGTTLILSVIGGLSIVTGGNQGSDEPTAPTQITFDTLTIDTSKEIEIPSGYEIDHYTGTSGLYLIQFNQNTETWMLDGLLEMGMTEYQYLNRNTYVIEIPVTIEGDVSELPHVQWLGIYQPYYKMSEEVRQSTGQITVEFELTSNGEPNHISHVIQSYDGSVNNVQTIGTQIIRATMDRADLPDILNEPTVVWTSLYHAPIPHMNLIRLSAYTGADTAYTGGFDGSGILGQVKDNGCDLNHPELTNVIYTQGSVVQDSHGTCTTGITFATGVDPDARGMLPAGEGSFSDWGVGREAGIEELWNPTGGVPGPGYFESNSWSQGTLNGQYTSYANQDDTAMHDHPYVLMMYALGNSNSGMGEGLITQDSANKNGIGVGAIYHKNTANMGDDDYSQNGIGNTPSRGFAADDRMKPDLIACFDWIYTVDADPGGYVGGEYYNDFGGTSGATPIVAGQVGLAYEMYIENHFGNNPTNDIPYGATIKAMMIADAYQYPLETGGNLITRNVQGWGSADIENTHNLGATGHYIVDGVHTATSGSTTTYYVTPNGGGTPLKISLAWTDPPASSSTGGNPAIINNLDLKVIAPDSTEYYGNNGLDDSLWSTSGTISTNYWSTSTPNYVDDLNTVENVFIQNPIAGLWTVEVSGHLGEVPQGPQRFSLVASGAQEGSLDNLPTVTVTAPDGGEVWDVGSNHDITWTMSDNEDPVTDLEVTIDYSTNGGASYPYNIISAQTGFTSPASYNWLIPNTPSTNARVRITVTDTSAGSDVDASDSVFTINTIGPTVTVDSPNGGESLKGGGTWDILWTATAGTNPLDPTPISIDYSVNGPGGPWNAIASNELNDGLYTWDPIPAFNYNNCYIRVTAEDDMGFTGSDISDSNFRIDSTAPQPAANPYAEISGTDVTIYWDASPSTDVDHYVVYYVMNGWDSTGDTYSSTLPPTSGISIVHGGVGITSGNSYFYQIRTYDAAGNEARTTVQAGKVGTTLSVFTNPSGWFMLGSFITQSDTALGHVLQGQGFPSNWDHVQKYDSFDSADPWKTYIEGRPSSVNDLSDLDNDEGFWLHVTGNSRWTTAGYATDMAIPMKAGWNLVPYPFAQRSMTSASIAAHLAANCPNFDSMMIFDSSAPYRLITPTGTETMFQGYGFWVRVSTDTTWTVTNY